MTDHPVRGISVSGDRFRVIDNALRNNGLDLFWDGVGASSCWKFNAFATSMPALLPRCTP